MARGGRPLPWGPIAVAVLAVVVGALVFLALRPPEPTTAGVEGQPTTAPTATPETTPAPTRTPQPTKDGGSAAPDEPSRERPLDVLNADAAVRAVAGDCSPGDAVIELTTDGGSSWVPVSTPADQVLRVTWAAEDDLWLIGGDAPECGPQFTRSADEGATWEAPSGTDGAWHLLPARDATQVHAPEADVGSPCAPGATIELESVSADEAFVLCDDGDVQSTGDGGESWTSVGGARGAVALGLTGGTPVLARPGGDGCDGLSVGPLGSDEPVCVEGAPSRRVAVAFAGEAGVLLAGTGVWTTSDAGASWREVLPPQ
jgi:photosystem II stability/assembly factor-like uncharacterized protein